MIKQIKAELQTFVLAVQFLTRVPIPAGSAYTAERFATSARHYPLVGILIGCVSALVYVAGHMIWPALIAVLLSTAVSMLLTGGFHEDGLADCFDGIGGGTNRQRALEIMKDSRIGTFGMLAAVVVLALKISALTLLDATSVVYLLVASHALSRLSSVVVIATSHYARHDGSGKPISTRITRTGLFYAVLVGAACGALLFFRLSPEVLGAALLGLLLTHVGIRLYFERKLGGYTGDCLGATQQVSEVGIYLGALACQ